MKDDPHADAVYDNTAIQWTDTVQWTGYLENGHRLS